MKGKKATPKAVVNGVPIPGSAVVKEAEAPSQSFKRGGKTKDCGPADGTKMAGRADKPQRRADGGRVNNRGRSPFSNAANMTAPAGLYEKG